MTAVPKKSRERIIDSTLPQVAEEILEVNKVVYQERSSRRIVEQIVDGLIP